MSVLEVSAKTVGVDEENNLVLKDDYGLVMAHVNCNMWIFVTLEDSDGKGKEERGRDH